MQLNQKDYNIEILHVDIDNVAMLTKQNFEITLCCFICEAKKSRKEGDSIGKRLHYLKKKGLIGN